MRELLRTKAGGERLIDRDAYALRLYFYVTLRAIGLTRSDSMASRIDAVIEVQRHETKW